MTNPLGLLRYLKFSKLCKNHSKASLSTPFTVFLYDDDAAAHFILYPASINEMPAPKVVFVFINYKISYKIFYNCFRVISV